MEYYHKVATRTELLRLRKELNMSGDTHAHSIKWDGGINLYTPDGSGDRIMLRYDREEDRELIDLLVGERLLGESYDYENDRCVTLPELRRVTSLGTGIAGRIVDKSLEFSGSTITDMSILEHFDGLTDISGVKGSEYRNMFAMSRLAKVRLPGTLTEIGASAFAFCLALTDVVIPESVTAIKAKAFYNCTSLPSIEIPASVTSIGNSAFNNDAALAEIVMRPATPPSLGAYAFRNIAEDYVIYVPKGKKSAYKKAWTDHAAHIAEIKK